MEVIDYLHADFFSKMFIATVLSHLMEVRCYFSFSAFQSGLGNSWNVKR